MLKAVQENSRQTALMKQMKAQIDALTQEKEMLSKNVRGLEEMMFSSQGGGAIKAQNEQAAPAYGAFSGEGGAQE